MTAAVATASLLVGVLDNTWGRTRDRRPHVPEVVVVVAAGSDGRTRAGLQLDHFAASRWHVGEARREVLVGGEGLARGPVTALGTLLHEATHGLRGGSRPSLMTASVGAGRPDTANH